MIAKDAGKLYAMKVLKKASLKGEVVVKMRSHQMCTKANINNPVLLESGNFSAEYCIVLGHI